MRTSYRPTTYTEIEDVLCTRETDKAILCVIGENETWVPKSQIGKDSQVKHEDDEGTLLVSEWFAQKIGAM
jgi:hypothetical protein